MWWRWPGVTETITPSWVLHGGAAAIIAGRDRLERTPRFQLIITSAFVPTYREHKIKKVAQPLSFVARSFTHTKIQVAVAHICYMAFFASSKNTSHIFFPVKCPSWKLESGRNLFACLISVCSTARFFSFFFDRKSFLLTPWPPFPPPYPSI